MKFNTKLIIVAIAAGILLLGIFHAMASAKRPKRHAESTTQSSASSPTSSYNSSSPPGQSYSPHEQDDTSSRHAAARIRDQHSEPSPQRESKSPLPH